MRRRLPFLRLILLLTFSLLLAATALLVFVRIDRIVIAPGHLVGGSLAVRAPRAGRVAEVMVESGQPVEPGAELLRFAVDELQTERRLIEVRHTQLVESLASLSLERRRLIEEIHPRDREQSEMALEQASLELDAAKTQHQRFERLFEQNLSTEIEVEAARLALELSRVALAAARNVDQQLPARQANQLDELDRREQALRGDLAEVDLRRRDLEQRLADSVVCAPCGGIVLGLDLDELEGRALAAGEELFRLGTGAVESFHGHVDDVGRALVRTGKPVRIRMSGYPWLVHGTLDGRVVRTEERREPAGFPVVIAVDPSTAPGDLYEGLTGQARILIEEDFSLGRLLLEKLVDRGPE